jgi:hypothetical protein
MFELSETCTSLNILFYGFLGYVFSSNSWTLRSHWVSPRMFPFPPSSKTLEGQLSSCVASTYVAVLLSSQIVKSTHPDGGHEPQ